MEADLVFVDSKVINVNPTTVYVVLLDKDHQVCFASNAEEARLNCVEIANELTSRLRRSNQYSSYFVKEIENGVEIYGNYSLYVISYDSLEYRITYEPVHKLEKVKYESVLDELVDNDAFVKAE